MPNCKAKSSRTGKPCQRPALKGMTVCRTHGGAAPQTIAAAKLRLLEMRDPAMAVLMREMKRETDTPNQVALNAAKDVLDRCAKIEAEDAGISSAAAPVTVIIQDLRNTSRE